VFKTTQLKVPEDFRSKGQDSMAAGMDVSAPVGEEALPPLGDTLTASLMGVLAPVVEQIDGHVRATQASQNRLRDHILELESGVCVFACVTAVAHPSGVVFGDPGVWGAGRVM